MGERRNVQNSDAFQAFIWGLEEKGQLGLGDKRFVMKRLVRLTMHHHPPLLHLYLSRFWMYYKGPSTNQSCSKGISTR